MKTNDNIISKLLQHSNNIDKLAISIAEQDDTMQILTFPLIDSEYTGVKCKVFPN